MAGGFKFPRCLALLGSFAFPRCLTFTGALAFPCYFAPIIGIALPAPGWLAIVGTRVVSVIVTIFAARFPAELPVRLLTVFAARFLTRLRPIVVSPAVVIVVFVIGEPHRVAVIGIAGPDDAVE